MTVVLALVWWDVLYLRGQFPSVEWRAKQSFRIDCLVQKAKSKKKKNKSQENQPFNCAVLTLDSTIAVSKAMQREACKLRYVIYYFRAIL